MRRNVRIAVWCVVALALWPFHGRLDRELRTANPVAHSGSALADSVLRTNFASPIRETALLVIGGLSEPANRESGRVILRRIMLPISKVEGVGSVISPASSLDTLLVGSSGTVAIALVGLTSDDPTVLLRLREASARVLAGERASNSALTLQWTGQPAVLADLRTSGAASAARAELIAFPMTLLVAWWAFGSLWQALLAVIVAALVTVIATGAMGLLSSVFPPSIMARSIVSLVGLALTVDYLLLMTRAHRFDDRVAQRRSRSTALLAATIVAAGFVGLTLAPTGELRTTAVTGALVAVLAALAAITFGTMVSSPVRVSGSQRSTRWLAWSTRVTRHPVRFALVSLAPLLLLANHARSAVLSTPLDNWLPRVSESTQALELLARENRLSVVGTSRVVLQLPEGMRVFSADGWSAVARLGERIRALPHAGDLYSITTIGTGDRIVAQNVLPVSVRDRYVSRDERSALLDVIPRGRSGKNGSSGTADAINLVEELRAVMAKQSVVSGETNDSTILPGTMRSDASLPDLKLAGATMLVSGLPAYSIDYQQATRDALPRVVIAASLATLLALLLTLRAPVVAIKAVSLNLLVAAAAMGATVLVFQDGIGIGMLQREAVGSILPTVPLLGFAATFGISMDYELFLLNAVMAERGPGRSEDEAIATGMARSAGLITRAAAVMIAVFAAFAASDLLPLAMLGFALATAVLLDATLVRLVLAPALLAIAGKWNWWPHAFVPNRQERVRN